MSKGPDIWVLVALSRPDCVHKVKDNFIRQAYSEKKLLIVENGKGKGACEAAGFFPDRLVQYDLPGAPNPGDPWNRGLEELREIRAEYVVMMDDDDWYGTEYLTEHAALAHPGRIVGKLSHWVDFGDGVLRLFGKQYANKKGVWARGGTLGFHPTEVGTFSNCGFAEDISFCKDFLKAGGEVLNSSVSHALYNRTGTGHAYTATRRSFSVQQGIWFEEYPMDLSLLNLPEPPAGVRKPWNSLP